MLQRHKDALPYFAKVMYVAGVPIEKTREILLSLNGITNAFFVEEVLESVYTLDLDTIKTQFNIGFDSIRGAIAVGAGKDIDDNGHDMAARAALSMIFALARIDMEDDEDEDTEEIIPLDDDDGSDGAPTSP